MATKTAISILQEHAVKNFQPFPLYEYEDVTNSLVPKFACHCSCGSVSFTATASTKKGAKQLSAEGVLKQLGVTMQVDVKDLPQVSPVVNGASYASSATYVTLQNPIGKLNEYCSQNKYAYPVYNEMGVSNGHFVIRCVHQSLVAEGLGSAKKEAKQKAAYNMLEMLGKVTPGERSKPTRQQSPARPVDKNQITELFTDEEIIKCFHEMSLKRKLTTAGKLKQPYELTDPFMPDIVKKEPVVEVKDESIVELESQLRKLNVVCDIKTIQKEPCILALNIKDRSYLETGKNYNEVKYKLLTNALEHFSNE